MKRMGWMLPWAAALGVACSSGSEPTSSVIGTATLLGRAEHGGTVVKLFEAGLSTRTAADGFFSIFGVPDGLYTLTFENGGYREVVPNVLALPGGEGLVVHETVTPLEAIELQRATRLSQGARAASGAVASPDGSLLLFVAESASGGQAKLKVARADGLAIGTIATEPAIAFYRFVMNGTRVLYGTPSGESAATLRLVSAQGGEASTLGTNVSSYLASANGRWAAFVSSKLSGSAFVTSLRLADLANGSVRDLVVSPSIQMLAFTPWSDRLLYRFFDASSQRFAYALASLKSETETRVPLEDTLMDAPIFSPDGWLLAYFVQTDAGGVTLKLHHLADGVTSVVGERVLTHALSPARDALAFLTAPAYASASVMAGAATLRVLSLKDGTVSAPTTGLASAASLRVADGGAYVLVASPDPEAQWPSSTAILQAVPMGGGEPRLLATGLTRFEVSPDGLRVLTLGDETTFADGVRAGALRVITIGDGGVRLLDARAGVYGVYGFTAQSDRIVGLYYVGSEGARLRAYSVSGDAVVTLAEGLFGAVTGLGVESLSMGFSPDGAWAHVVAARSELDRTPVLRAVPMVGGEVRDLVSHVTRAFWVGSRLVSERRGAQPYEFLNGVYASELP